MCLLMVKPKGNELPSNLEDICRDASFYNDDGMGFCTPDQRFVHDSISHDWFARIIRENVTKDDPCIIHFRLGTSGKNNKANCHPFKLPDGTMFAHNGVINSDYPPVGECSDTRMLSLACNNYDELWERCLSLVSSYNKFAIIHPQRTKDSQYGVDIIGEIHGTWEQGIWFSNMHWQRRSGYPSRLSWLEEDYIPSSSEIEDQSLTAQVADLVNRYGYTAVNNSLLRVKAWTQC